MVNYCMPTYLRIILSIDLSESCLIFNLSILLVQVIDWNKRKRSTNYRTWSNLVWHFFSPIVLTYTSVWHSKQPVPIGYLTSFLYFKVTVFKLIYHCYSTYVNSLSHSHHYTDCVLRRTFLTSHILKSKNIVYLNSFNTIIWSFFSFNIQNIQFLSHPLAQVSTNHTRNGNAFSLSRVVLSSFYLTAPLQHFQLEMCAVASCSKNWPSSLTLIQTLS